MLACHVGDAQLQVERSEQGASVRQGPRAAQCREREQARSICSIVSSCNIVWLGTDESEQIVWQEHSLRWVALWIIGGRTMRSAKTQLATSSI